jgi:hypothetical protein
LRTRPAGGESDPDAPEPAVVLGPIKKWPGNQATRGTISATTILDWPCARRP